MNESLVAWESRGQQCIATSSSEAEYVAISDICKVLMFMKNILTFMGITIQLPMIVRVENVGAIYLAQGGDGKHTKTIDIHYHFVLQYIEDGVVQIIFVKSGENVADVYTKNTSGHMFIEHNRTYMCYIPGEMLNMTPSEHQNELNHQHKIVSNMGGVKKFE